MHQLLQAMIGHPNIVVIGPIAVTWYGLAYAVSFLLGWLVLHKTFPGKPWVDTLTIILILSSIIGGRLGYVFISSLEGTSPHSFLDFIAIHQGGMAWHGGLIVAVLSGYWYTKHFKLPTWRIADSLAPIIVLGIIMGRVANFINGELPGRITNEHLGFLFPGYAGSRYPDTLYEGALDLIALVAIYLFFRKTKHIPAPSGAIFAVTIVAISVSRFVAEFFRQPTSKDAFFTPAQGISAVIIILTIVLYYRGTRKN
jgi:phosphatidylglycerol:prolipoprotein diacylglycerol transferase